MFKVHLNCKQAHDLSLFLIVDVGFLLFKEYLHVFLLEDEEISLMQDTFKPSANLFIWAEV